MKNRKRESCTSGTVRDEDGNILIYPHRYAGFLLANRSALDGVAVWRNVLHLEGNDIATA